MIDFINNIFKKYVGNSKYKKNVLIMVVGRVIAQAIPILLTPLLTRIYSPEEFGVFAIYSIVVSLVAMVSNGRYCLSIILPKEREKAQFLVFLSSIFTIIVSLLFFVILLLVGKSFFAVLNIETLDRYLILLVLNILLAGLYEAIYYYALREKKYKILSSNIIIQAVVLITVRLITGYLGYTNIGLLISYLSGYFVGYILLFKRLELKLEYKIFKDNVKDLISKYSNFPKFSLFSDILGTLTTSLPSIFLNKIFGSGEVGYLSLSEKVLGAPIWFITSSVGDVFKQEASEQYRNGGSCKTIFVKTSKTLFTIGIIPFLLIFIFVPPLIPFVFGEIWGPAGNYIRFLSIMYFSSFIVNPTAHMVYIVNKQQYAALFQGSKIFSILIAFILGFYYKDLNLTLILWSSLVTLSNMLIFIISYKFARDSKYVGDDKETLQDY
jgi:O-antigen/teichoic acid export membrane protein